VHQWLSDATGLPTQQHELGASQTANHPTSELRDLKQPMICEQFALTNLFKHAKKGTKPIKKEAETRR
jgi:hypothetical protein